MELELKHLAPYLPYGLKGIAYVSKDIALDNVDITGCNRSELYCEYTSERYKNMSGARKWFDLYEVKPLLLPMSSLYTEMEDGTVPIVELAKIATGIQDWEVIEYQPTFGSRKIKFKPYLVAYNKEYNFRFFFRDKDFYLYDVDGARECTHQNQLDLFTYLFSHHFDVFSLIPQNLALDKTKIK